MDSARSFQVTHNFMVFGRKSAPLGKRSCSTRLLTCAHMASTSRLGFSNYAKSYLYDLYGCAVKVNTIKPHFQISPRPVTDQGGGGDGEEIMMGAIDQPKDNSLYSVPLCAIRQKLWIIDKGWLACKRQEVKRIRGNVVIVGPTNARQRPFSCLKTSFDRQSDTVALPTSHRKVSLVKSS